MQLPRQISPIGTIYLSKAKCIYKNLAFEEYIFRNHNLSGNGDALFLWRFLINFNFFVVC